MCIVGDLVRVTKGYKLKPSPQHGDIGLIVEHEISGELEREIFIVMFPNKPFRFWKVNSKNIEVI